MARRATRRRPPITPRRACRRHAAVAGCGWPRSRSRSPRSALPWRLRGSAYRRSGAGMIGRRASSQQATPSPPRARPSLLNHERRSQAEGTSARGTDHGRRLSPLEGSFLAPGVAAVEPDLLAPYPIPANAWRRAAPAPTPRLPPRASTGAGAATREGPAAAAPTVQRARDRVTSPPAAIAPERPARHPRHPGQPRCRPGAQRASRRPCRPSEGRRHAWMRGG